MSRVGTSIIRDESAYRRGLVLGLTMAEIMLLLVFCLLIAAAVIFKRDRAIQKDLGSRLAAQTSELIEAKADQRRAKAELIRLQRLVGVNNRSPEAAKKLDDEWRRLVAAEQAMESISAAGLLPERLAKEVADIKIIEILLDRGMTGTEIVEATEVAKAVEAATKSNDELANLPPVEVVRLAALGFEQEQSGEGEHDWPPIINLSEAKGYSFAVGRAELSPDFSQQLKSSIADDVVKNIEKYKANVVEVIGHTDEQAMTPRPSNLDTNLISVLTGKASVETLVPGDNAGLGMARAVSVAGVLRADPRFENVTVLPLSGGQMILPGDVVTDGSSSGDARERRRIEIRVRRPEAPTSP